MNHWIRLVFFSVALLQSVTLTAQSYRVVVDNSPFVRDGDEVGRVAAGTEIYALEQKGEQLLAVEPTSQTQAWIALDLVQLTPRSAQQKQSIERPVNRMDAIEKYVNASSASLAELEETIAWAEQLRAIQGDKHPTSAIAMEYAGLVAICATVFKYQSPQNTPFPTHF